MGKSKIKLRLGADASSACAASAGQCTLGVFMGSIIARMEREGRLRTARNYRSALNSFMRFRNGCDIPLGQVDVGVASAYEAWLKYNGVCRNTSSFYMRVLRAVYNRAAESGMVGGRHPFGKVYTGVDRTGKRAVGMAAVKAIRHADLSGSPSQDFARDMFVLSFCLRGMSFVDLAHLHKSDLRDGYLHYTRSKTRQTLCIRWEPLMQQIVDKYSVQTAASDYLLPILSTPDRHDRDYHNAQVRIGYHLKKVAKIAGLRENITLYVARHSWASIARNNGVPISVISEALGHDSEQTTNIYMQSIQTTEVDKANAKIIGCL